MKKIILALVLILLVTFAGTILYYNNLLIDRNNQITKQNDEIVDLKNRIAAQESEISNLTNQVLVLNNQITNLTNINLVTALGISEVPAPLRWGSMPQTYARLYIEGTVTNTGNETAYNAGLHVVAYTTNGTVVINMTVPLANGAAFATDGPTSAYIQANSIGSPSLGNLNAWQTATVRLNIYHEDAAVRWEVTPISK